MSDAVKPDNGQDGTVTDSLGRVLSIKTTGPAGMLDLIEIGGDAGSNNAWMRTAMVIAAVRAIDGVAVPAATTKAHIRRNAARIGNEGFAAVAKFLYGDPNALDDDTGADPDADDAAMPVDDEAAAAKN